METEFIGYIGCFFLFSSFIPQTFRLINKKQYDNVGYPFLILIMITSILMSIYSYIRNIYPVLIANISVFINNSVIFVLKCNHMNNIDESIL